MSTGPCRTGERDFDQDRDPHSAVRLAGASFPSHNSGAGELTLAPACRRVASTRAPSDRCDLSAYLEARQILRYVANRPEH